MREHRRRHPRADEHAPHALISWRPTVRYSWRCSSLRVSGYRQHFTRDQILNSHDCSRNRHHLLVIGAGGGFTECSWRAGGKALPTCGGSYTHHPSSRVDGPASGCHGSATVAMTTAAGIVAPIGWRRRDEPGAVVARALGHRALARDYSGSGPSGVLHRPSADLKTWTIAERSSRGGIGLRCEAPRVVAGTRAHCICAT